MNKLQKLVLSLGVVFSIGLSFIPASAGAINVYQPCKDTGSASAICSSTNDNANGLVQKIVNVLLYILGAVAIVVIVIAGIQYVVSSGDASRVKAAKDTLTYAIVGLIVAILAYAIVNFVITRFKP